MIGILSRGIARIPHLDTLLGEPCHSVWSRHRNELTKIAGWGLKPTSVRARRYAARHKLPYISLEDGFLRSLGLGVLGAVIHSLIVDRTGIYYDATRPSELEGLILGADFTAAELQRSHACMAQIRRLRLSKYNHAPDIPLLREDSSNERVLVVDQTFADPSVGFGLADESTFAQMLDAAIANNPGAEILVKIHPDVILGKKRGYLLKLAQTRNCRLIGEDLSPWTLLDAVDKVYVVTSQLGFEALIAGKEVHCFGMPFYAGWGLTHDQLQCERRGVSRSLEHLFAAAYLRYCRYINPYTGKRCELEDTIALIADQKRTLERFRGNWLAAGFSRWKRAFVPSFLGPAAKTLFIARTPSSLNGVGAGGRVSDGRVISWSSALEPEFIAACQRNGRQLWRMEDGFLRSVGLGADLVRPLSLVLDSRGIYYDATAASDLEVLLQDSQFSDELLARASRVRQQLVERRLSKYNVGQSDALALPRDRRLVLVPGQVETDASIAKGSPEIKTNLGLLEAVRKRNPDAFIIYKPHPDVVGGGRYGQVDSIRALGLYDLEVQDMAITDLLDQVNEVHTLSSLTGFEALLRGLKVVTYGMPFYAGWGLTTDQLLCARRTRTLSLNELVAATLILYPVYVDPASGDPVNIETAIALLARQHAAGPDRSLRTHVYRLFRNAFLKR